MAKWQATVEAPLSYHYGNYTVLKCGPWSQGPVMLQQLALLKALGFDSADPLSADFVHPVIEASKLAYADREVFYGDPDFVDVPIDVLLSDAYNAQRSRLITKQASMELQPGSIEGFGGTIKLRRANKDMQAGAGEPTVGALAGVGEPTVERTGRVIGDTVHFDIVDRAGNMISATPSGGWLQSSPIIPELGFCLGSRAQMFYLDESSPSALMPGKRPRSTLSPGMALRDGQPYLGFGTPGGDQQDQWATQFFLRHVHAGMNLQESIDCPAFHTEHFPLSFWPRTARPGVAVIEGRMPKSTIAELEKRGHIVEVGGDWSEGRLTAASRDGKLRKAAANPRGMQAYAAGR
jgi:gamma-glutamyltranspeptidase/glutathione hydrolase